MVSVAVMVTTVPELNSKVVAAALAAGLEFCSGRCNGENSVSVEVNVTFVAVVLE